MLCCMDQCVNNIHWLYMQPTTTKPPLTSTTLLMQNPYTTPFNETLKAGFADLRDAPRTQNLPLNQPPLSKQVISIFPSNRLQEQRRQCPASNCITLGG